MKKECESCGVEFEAERSTARFCGEKCKKAWQRAATGKEPEEVQGKTPVDSLLETRLEWHPVAMPQPVSVALERVPVRAVSARVRIWPAGMEKAEVMERLRRMRGYNLAMARQGVPQHGSTREYVVERLREVGMDEKLAGEVFP